MPNQAPSFAQIKTQAAKFTDVIVKESGKGKLLFTVYGGRLMGMFPIEDGFNALWVNEKLEESMAAGQWMTGGERLWIAPERDFFYENPRDFEGFHVPAEIDPGEFVAKDDLSFESVFSLLDYHTNLAIDNCIMKRSFALIDDPLASGLDYVGVKIHDSIRVPGEGIEMCGWSLSQVYTNGAEMPGTAFFPIKTGSDVLSYFNPIPADRTEALGGYARFKIDAAEIYKLAIRPEDMLFDNPVKAVYVTPAPNGETWLCLIKRTNDMPRSQDECVDVARGNPDGPKGAIQSFNSGPEPDNDTVMPFGEIELQLAKGNVRDGNTISEAVHELLAYQGSKEGVLELARKALNIAETPKTY